MLHTNCCSYGGDPLCDTLIECERFQMQRHNHCYVVLHPVEGSTYWFVKCARPGVLSAGTYTDCTNSSFYSAWFLFPNKNKVILYTLFCTVNFI